MRAALAVVALVALLGCPGEPVRPPVPAAFVAPVDGPASPLVDVTVRTLPADFRLDGDLDEWGASDGAAPSRLSVVVQGDQLVLAASLREAARAGIWVVVGFGVPPAPVFGQAVRGAGVEPVDCEALAARERDACRAGRKLLDAEVAAFQARFSQTYRVNRDGVRALHGARQEWLERERVASTAAEATVRVEASLPLALLPRAAQAPMHEVYVAAVGAGEPQPRAQMHILPRDVGFEPHAGLRAAVFGDAAQLGDAPTFWYQPGQGDLGATGSHGSGLSSDEAPMSFPLTTFGGFELRNVNRPRTAVAVLYRGDLVNYIAPIGDAIPLTVQVGNALHVLGYSQGADDVTAAWYAGALRGDGSYRTIAVADGPRQWDTVERFHAEDLSSFGVRGQPRGDARRLELTFRYDAKRDAYIPEERWLQK